MTKALVIDDDKRILETLREKLQSMEHECDTATSQEEALEFLSKNPPYNYILLDLQIPLRFQRPPDKEYGRNLLRRIKAMPDHRRTPVIVITSHGSTPIAVQLIVHEGAADFIDKPFGDGNSIEEKILGAMKRHPLNALPNQKETTTGSLQPFQGGFLDFFEDRVELCGIKVCGPKGRSTIRRVLDMLFEREEKKDKTPYSQNFFVAKLGLERGQMAVGEPVKDFRKKCVAKLRTLGFQANHLQDILTNDKKRGYRFAPGIMLRKDGRNLGTPASGPVPTPLQAEIRRELGRKARQTRRQLADRLKKTVKQIEDAMEPLLDQKLVKFTGLGAAARYSLVSPPSSSAS